MPGSEPSRDPSSTDTPEQKPERGANPAGNKGKLKRSLSLFDTVVFGIGGVLGAGIYAIVGEVAGLSGSLVWLSLAIAAVTATLTAAVYGELVSLYPDAGGGYEYIAQGFGRKFANVCSVLLFLTSVIAAAAIALAFADYLGRLVDLDKRITAPLIVVAMAVVNVIGVQQASWFNIGATALTLGGLLLVAIAAAPSVGERELTTISDRGWAGVFGGAALSFFAYVGFEDLVKMAEETKAPRRTMPRALMISSAVVLVIYLVIAVAVVSAEPWKDLAGSSGPLSSVLENQWGGTWATVLTVIALFAISKTILTNVLSGSRLVFDVARDTKLPDFLRAVTPKTGTPVVAIALVATLACAFSLIGDLGAVASISNLCILTLFLIVNLSLVRIRLTRPGEKAEFRLPLNIGNVSVINIAATLAVATLAVFNILNLTGALQ